MKFLGDPVCKKAVEEFECITLFMTSEVLLKLKKSGSDQVHIDLVLIMDLSGKSPVMCATLSSVSSLRKRERMTSMWASDLG
ncbi:hypothetical protein [Streptomyces yangpuensis]|uniref:hypothetical protein n=1 Tax=Streptomyces yangpuensis TaxID=1648182 RepID=UPI00381DB371